MKKFLLRLLFPCMLLCALSASAQPQVVEVDNVFYQLNGNRASLVARPDGTPYTGHMKLHGVITHEGNDYEVRIQDNSPFGDIDELTFLSDCKPVQYRIWGRVNGKYQAPAQLERINLEALHFPPNADNGYSRYEILLGEPCKAASVEIYYTDPDHTIVKINWFNVYGPDGKQLRPFLMSETQQADGQYLRIYPDENGVIELGKNFRAENDEYVQVMGTSAYTLAYLYVEYDGKLACIRTHFDPNGGASFTPEGSNLSYKISNRGQLITSGFTEGADTGCDLVIPESVNSLPVEYIAEGAFAGTAVRSVSIPASMAEIGYNAFYGCGDLETVRFAKPTISCRVNNYSFANCTKLSDVIFDPEINNSSSQIRFYSGVFSTTPALRSLAIPQCVNIESIFGSVDQSGVMDVQVTANDDEYVTLRVASRLTGIDGTPLPICVFTRPYDYSISNYSITHVYNIEAGIVTVPKADLYDIYSSRKQYNGRIYFGYPSIDNPLFTDPVTDGSTSANSHYGYIYVPEAGMPVSTSTEAAEFAIAGDGYATLTSGWTVANGMAIVPPTVKINGKEYAVTSIAPGAFADRSALTELRLPSSIASIGEGALRGTSLQALDLPAGCVADNIFGIPAATLEQGADNAFDNGLLSIALTENNVEGAELTVGTAITADGQPLPLSAFVTDGTTGTVFDAVNGIITIPAAYLLGSAPMQPASRAAEAPRTVNIGFAANPWVPGADKAVTLQRIFITPSDIDGVDNITVDGSDAPARYYNLQGVSVDGSRLAPGLYLRRQGGRTTKVTVR